MRSLLPLSSLFALSLYVLSSSAHEGELDDLGCHEEITTSVYHCHSGPLSSREFVSREEAEEALHAMRALKERDKLDDQAIAANLNTLKILSWNFSSIGKKRVEYDRIVAVMRDVDLVVMQEVEFSASGESALTVIANLWAQRINQRVCKAWFKSGKGERGRHAFLWRDSSLGFVEKNGEIKENCGEAPVVIRTDGLKIKAQDSYAATFYSKAKRQMFQVVSVYFERRPAKADKDVTRIFQTAGQPTWPAIIAGNFKVPAPNKAFRENRFKALLVRKGTATSNVWTKGLSLVRAEAIELSERFPDMKARDVDNFVSSHPPLYAELSFSLGEAEVLKTQLVRKTARALKTAAREKSRPIKPDPKPLPVHDNLEDEAE